MNLTDFAPPSDPKEVSEMVAEVLERIRYPQSIPLARRLVRDVVDLFEGRHPDYQAVDLAYHDLSHTLQATVCAARILEGANSPAEEPLLSRRDCELLLAAVLLHDSGYLKRKDDIGGTGAKYLLVHERRSCEFAAAYLQGLDFAYPEITDVTHAIRCTGPGHQIDRISFRRPAARTVAAILVTADYLGQMAASDYVYELPILFRESQEGHDFAGTPPSDRPFKSASYLMRKIPDFWSSVIRPMLDVELEGVYRYIAPLPDGRNPYIVAVERNIDHVRALDRAPDVSIDPFPTRKYTRSSG